MLPRIADRRQHDVVALPAVHRAARRSSSAAAGPPILVAAQNMHSRTSRARSPARSRHRCWSSSASRRRVLGHSERRQLFGETDEALAQKVPAALGAGLEPILCVGETEEERDGGETEDVLERQLQADLAAVADEDLAEVVIAYEPIWAIGTGKVGHARAGPGGVRVHPRLVAARARGGGRRRADPLRRLGQARERRRAARAARRRRRASSAARPSTPTTSPRSSRPPRERASAGPVAAPVPSVALVILDGWGLAPPGPGNAVALADTPVFDELWARYPHTSSRPQGRDVGLPDGQMGNSEVGHLNLGAGRGRASRTWRGSTTRSPTAPSPKTRRCVAACARRGESPRGRLHLLGLVSDGGVHSGWEHLEALHRAGRARRASRTSSSTPSPTAATPRRPGGRGYLAELERWLRAAGRVGTVGGRYYAMDRDTPLGADQARLRRDRPRATGPKAASCRRGGRGRLRATARPTSSSCRP